MATPGRPRKVSTLQARLTALAGTPDDDTDIGIDLIVIAHLTATSVAGADHVSVTARHDGTYVTVAASDNRAADLDRAQYDDDAGPCLEALDGGYPAAVPDIAATVTWPGFRAAAAECGVRTSLSIPLVAGSGRTIASLNVYGRDPDAMALLTDAVWAAYDPENGEPPEPDGLEPGGRDLAAGLAGAVAARPAVSAARRTGGCGRAAGPR